MAYDPTPTTTRAHADYITGTTRYTLGVLSYASGRDIIIERERSTDFTPFTEIDRTGATVSVPSGGGVQIDILDTSLFQTGDVIYATRSSEAVNPSSFSGTGSASNLAVRSSMTRIFAILRELIQETFNEETSGVTLPQVQSAITTALAAVDPQFTAALKTRLEGTMSRAQVEAAIDDALDDLPQAVRDNVTGAFVISLIDTATGSTSWRTLQQPSISVDPNQLGGDGSAASPINILTDGITVGLIAANAVQTRNIGDQQVTLTKLSSVLQARWNELSNAITNITTSGGIATATQIDGTTLTFSVGTGRGGMGGGSLEVFDIDPQGQVRSRGSATEIVFRDSSVAVSGDRATVAPVFPARQQADWTETDTADPTFIRNKPGGFVDTYTTRPTTFNEDRLYAWAGEPDKYGGAGLYQAVANADTPLNLVAAQIEDSTALRATQTIQALPTSQTNHWLNGFGMDIASSSNGIFVWLDATSPTAGTLYAQIRTDNGSGTWSVWGSIITLLLDDSRVLPTGLTRPANSKQYYGLPGGIPANWTGGYGRNVQIRMWRNAGATQEYDLKLSHTLNWIEDPELAKAYLITHPLSTHDLEDGAVARVVSTTPTDFSDYKEGELVLDLSTNPVSLKVVTGNRDQVAPNSNRFEVSTDEQGNGVAAQGDFENDPNHRYFQIHVAAGDGTASHPGRVSLYLEPPSSPPETILARPVTGGFPLLTFGRIQGNVGTIAVGNKTYYGYQASFVSTNLHVFGDATFAYDLYTSYTSSSVNTPLNVQRDTRHIPARLVDVGGSGGGASVPSGGWGITQIAAENRQASNITVDASGFSGNLGTGDTNVQTALASLDGAARGRPVSMLSADQPTETGQVPLWTADSKWIASKITAMADALAVSDGLDITLSGKLLEIYNAFGGGSWGNVSGALATTPAVISTPLSATPTGILGTWTFTTYASNISPAWPQTQGGQTWIVVRMPSGLDFREERYRLSVVDASNNIEQSVNLDDAAVSLIGSAGGFHYYRLQVTRIGAGEGYRMQGLTPFAPVRSRLDLVTSMLRDFVPVASRTSANNRRVVVWDNDDDEFVLGSPERPAPVSTLPSTLEVGRRYILTQDANFQPWYEATATAQSHPELIWAAPNINPDSPRWSLERYASSVPSDPPLAGQLVLSRSASVIVDAIAVTINGTTYNVQKRARPDDNEFIVQAAPSIASGTTLQVVIHQDGSDLHNFPPAVEYEAGDWTADNPFSLVATPGTAAQWAQAGQPRPRLAFNTLFDGTGSGLSVTHSGSNQQTAFDLFSPSFDLDDADNQTGIVFVEGIARLHSKSDSLISFSSATTSQSNAVDAIEFSGFATLSALRALADYSNNTTNTLLIGGDIPVYLSGSVISNEQYRLGHNANNELGRAKFQRGSTGSSSFSVSFQEYVYVEVNDGAGSGGGGSATFTGLTDTPSAGVANQWLKWNASGTALENTAAPATASLAWDDITGKPATATRNPTYAEVTGTKPPTNAEQNVQANWTEGNSSSDAFIRNKPTIPAPVTSLPWGSITGKPATATRNPTYAEVTGTKPPTNAEQNVQANWTENNTGNDAYIRNKPSIPSQYTDAMADARVRAGVEDWAEDGNTDRLPTSKLGTGTADSGKVLYGDRTWKDAPSGGGGTTSPASETAAGIIEIASNDEADTGTDDTRAMTPFLVKRRIDSGVQVWARDTTTDIPSSKLPTTPSATDLRAGVIRIASDQDIFNGTNLTEAVVPRRLDDRINQRIESWALKTGGASIPASELGNVPTATSTRRGTIEIANESEADTGTDNSRAMTPFLVKRRVDAATGEREPKGRKIAECTIPAGVKSAGAYQNINWTIESDFTSDYRGNGGGLQLVERCVDHPGWVLEGVVNDVVVSCSWIPASGLNPGSSGRADSANNFVQDYKIALNPQTSTSATRVRRAVNIQFQRDISQWTSDQDGFWIYGTGQQAILANTKLVMYEWVGGTKGAKGDKGDKGDPGTGGGTTSPASTTTAGIIEIANNAEADGGADNSRAMTPFLVKRRIDAISAPTWDEVTGKPAFAPANAEQNVQANWTETDTNSDAFIRNKPTSLGGSTTFTGLTDTPSALTGQGGKHVAVNSGATALEFVDAPSGGGGTAPSLAEVNATLLTITPSAVGTWSGWQTLMTSASLTSAGVVSLHGLVRGNVTSDTTGGGDRVYVEARLVRTRASVDTPIDYSMMYLRNGGNFGTQALEDASQMMEKDLGIADQGMIGDTYKIEVQVISQRILHTVQFTTDSKLQVVSGGGGGAAASTGPIGAKIADGTLPTSVAAGNLAVSSWTIDSAFSSTISVRENAIIHWIRAFEIGDRQGFVLRSFNGSTEIGRCYLPFGRFISYTATDYLSIDLNESGGDSRINVTLSGRIKGGRGTLTITNNGSGAATIPSNTTLQLHEWV